MWCRKMKQAFVSIILIINVLPCLSYLPMNPQWRSFLPGKLGNHAEAETNANMINTYLIHRFQEHSSSCTLRSFCVAASYTGSEAEMGLKKSLSEGVEATAKAFRDLEHAARKSNRYEALERMVNAYDLGRRFANGKFCGWMYPCHESVAVAKYLDCNIASAICPIITLGCGLSLISTFGLASAQTCPLAAVACGVNQVNCQFLDPLLANFDPATTPPAEESTDDAGSDTTAAPVTDDGEAATSSGATDNTPTEATDPPEEPSTQTPP